MTNSSAEPLGTGAGASDPSVAGGSRVAAEMLAALLVVHVVFLLFIAHESPVLFNLIILLQRSIPAEIQDLLVAIGGGLVDANAVIAERLSIGLFYGAIWLGLIVWLWRRGGFLVPILALSAGGWEVYWRIRIVQFMADSGQPQIWLVLFGLLSAGVAIVAGVIGIIAAASRGR